MSHDGVHSPLSADSYVLCDLSTNTHTHQKLCNSKTNSIKYWTKRKLHKSVQYYAETWGGEPKYANEWRKASVYLSLYLSRASQLLGMIWQSHQTKLYNVLGKIIWCYGQGDSICRHKLTHAHMLAFYIFKKTSRDQGMEMSSNDILHIWSFWWPSMLQLTTIYIINVTIERYLKVPYRPD